MSKVSGVIHISFGGPGLNLHADRPYRFEDHPYCGPIIVNAKGDPLTDQPVESSPFWHHYDAWSAQGKRTKKVGSATWCVYETRMQMARRLGRQERVSGVQLEGPR